MAGSPTLLINGRNPFPNPSLQGSDCGPACRVNRDEYGQTVRVPSVVQLRDAVGAAEASAAPRLASAGSAGQPLALSGDEACCEPVRPGDVLSAWRIRALPLDPVEKAVHQAILRAYAATGRPPAATWTR